MARRTLLDTLLILDSVARQKIRRHEETEVARMVEAAIEGAQRRAGKKMRRIIPLRGQRIFWPKEE